MRSGVAIYSYGYNVNSLRIEIATTYRRAVGLAMTVRLVVIARSEATKQSLIVFFKKSIRLLRLPYGRRSNDREAKRLPPPPLAGSQ